jgi:hypothetical protein
MKFDTKYHNGDVVWVLMENRNHMSERCPVCIGAGHLFNIKKESIKCYNCDGKGTYTLEEAPSLWVPVQRKINHIGCESPTGIYQCDRVSRIEYRVEGKNVLNPVFSNEFIYDSVDLESRIYETLDEAIAGAERVNEVEWFRTHFSKTENDYLKERPPFKWCYETGEIVEFDMVEKNNGIRVFSGTIVSRTIDEEYNQFFTIETEGGISYEVAASLIFVERKNEG